MSNEAIASDEEEILEEIEVSEDQSETETPLPRPRTLPPMIHRQDVCCFFLLTLFFFFCSFFSAEFHLL
jgi:hypothetical protein